MTFAAPLRALRLGTLLAPLATAAGAVEVAPWKDDLFANHEIRSAYDGAFRTIEYNRDRDLYGRDEIPEKKAFPRFVTVDDTIAQRDLVLGKGEGRVRYVAVGKTENVSFIVIFLHGDRGSRFQAMDDWSFGGNFNRLKNLVARSGGAYLSADYANFGKAGTANVRALVKAAAGSSPGAPVILACTSRSGELCFHLMEDREAAPLLAGVVLLGTNTEESFFKSPTFRDPARHIPIFIGHGQNDKLMTWVTMELFFKKVKAASPGYPIRLDLFVDGAHGTPMRLIDWREALNWMLAKKGG